MKTVGMAFVLLWMYFASDAQEIQNEQEQLIETVSEESAILENEGDLIESDYYRRHPVDLNKVSQEDLRQTNLFTEEEILNFLSYRKLVGELIHIYELQAIPGWTHELIMRLLPFVKVVDHESLGSFFQKTLKEGEHQLLIRLGSRLTKSDEDKDFRGNALGMLVRYNYRYKTEWRVGITGDKDAGEPFFTRNNKFGFDFYSVHFYLKPAKKNYALALGDYTIQLGQGLIQWQGLAFGKSSETMMINRQSPMLKPYTSTGEFNFHRGIGVHFTQRNWQYLGFISLRKLSANFEDDSATNSRHISSIQTSGYHRTNSEIVDKNRLSMFSGGVAGRYGFRGGSMGAQLIGYYWGDSLLKENRPYNYFSFAGKRLMNASIDGRWTYRNYFLFGELAIDQKLSKAVVTGAVLSLGKGLDFSLLLRHYDRSFQHFFSNSFSEFGGNSEEEGLYLGLQYKLSNAIRMSVYSDVFRWNWVRYGFDRPGAGWKTLVQLNYNPSKTSLIYVRFRRQHMHDELIPAANQPASSGFRIHLEQALHKQLKWRARIETVRISEQKRTFKTGALFFSDFAYTSLGGGYGMVFRISFFDTDGYEARLYAFEPDVLFSYNTPVFYGKGWRWMVNFKLKTKNFFDIRVARNMTCWVKIAQSFEIDKQPAIQYGLKDIITNNLNIRFQLISTF